MPDGKPVLPPLASTPALEGRGRILIADADLAFLEATSATLKSSGFEVTAVSTTDQALAVVDAQLQDALVVDIDLPGNHDLEFLHALRARQPLLPIVVLTGKPTLDSAVAAFRLGVADYLTKPPGMDELGRSLDAAVQHGRGLRSIDGSEQLASELVRRLHSLKSAASQGPGSRLAAAPPGTSEEAHDSLRNLPHEDLVRLSARERDVLRELAKGHAPQRIAKTLGLSTNTIRNHLKSIFLKLGVTSQVALLGKLARTR